MKNLADKKLDDSCLYDVPSYKVSYNEPCKYQSLIMTLHSVLRLQGYTDNNLKLPSIFDGCSNESLQYYNDNKYILNQWIAFLARVDWLATQTSDIPC